METPNANNLKTDMELFLDAHGTDVLFDLISEIASEKADHLRTAWQDTDTSREWEKLARAINRLPRIY